MTAINAEHLHEFQNSHVITSFAGAVTTDKTVEPEPQDTPGVGLWQSVANHAIGRRLGGDRGSRQTGIEMTTALNVLMQLRTLSEVPPAQLEKLAGEMAIHKFRRRDIIHVEANFSDALFLVLSGVVKVLEADPKRGEVLAGILAPGEIFGIARLLPQSFGIPSLALGINRRFRWQAATNCLIGQVEAGRFASLVFGVALPRYRKAVEMTFQRFWFVLARHSNYLFDKPGQRLAVALLELASNFGVSDDRGVIINVAITHQELANLIGSSRPRISQFLKEMEASKVITRQGRRLVVQTAKLETLTQS
jgi:CRP/FNR family transcriptional regulator, cyclic AMP receptor protein